MRRAGLEPDPVQCQVATTLGHQLVMCHRQWGKSRIASAIALEDACGADGRLILLVSRSMRQSGELFRKVKEFYNLTRPLPLVKDTEHELELSNGSRIISLPGSPDTIVGYSSVYRLILDEAARIPDETYYAVRPMLAMSGGTMLALSTPFGRRGWFYEAWEGTASDEHALDVLTVERLLADLDFPVDEYSETGAAVSPTVADDLRSYTWHKTFIPCTHNPRLSRAFLADERRKIPALWFDQEWLCKFVELGEVVFRWDDLMAMMSTDVQPVFGEDGVVVEDGRVVREDVAPLALNGWTH
jgi:hypothetical protein